MSSIVPQQMKWYERALRKNRRQTISSGVFAITSALALLLWHYGFSQTFTWESISPISTPLEYAFYSALVFVGPGYYIRFHTTFYKNLWNLRRIGLHDLHRGIKKIVWLTMCLIVLATVIMVVWAINHIVSFLYNILRLMLFLWPPLGIGLVAGVIAYMLLKKDSIPLD